LAAEAVALDSLLPTSDGRIRRCGLFTHLTQSSNKNVFFEKKAAVTAPSYIAAPIANSLTLPFQHKQLLSFVCRLSSSILFFNTQPRKKRGEQ
jgi:hypothetical protein